MLTNVAKVEDKRYILHFQNAGKQTWQQRLQEGWRGMGRGGGGGRGGWVTCRKYRPSVQRAAASVVTTAVPAEPVKPEMKCRRSSQEGAYSLCITMSQRLHNLNYVTASVQANLRA